MPYTPPSQLSPVVSKQSTPAPSRSHSYVQQYAQPDFVFPPREDRPVLPRSAGSSSYLSKHRRSPSTPTGSELPEAMTDMQRGVGFDIHGSIRQSPPPSTSSTIPPGMTISPPESSHNSDDEEVRGRSRQLELENLAELQKAIRGLGSDRKAGSPSRRAQEKIQSEGRSQRVPSPPQEEERPPLSTSQRRISHSRSSSDNFSIERDVEQKEPESTHVPYSPSFAGSATDSDENEESHEYGSRPPMVRKKSGELVKPALRPHSRRRPSSMPGTPTYSKAVHFDSQLEHVRHFLQVDRPLAVSAGSSPADNYESENEFPFGSAENGSRSRTSAPEWEIRLANFPPESDERKTLPVWVERIILSADKKSLVGTVAVQNLAFQKAVAVRFTFDYWKTTSEIAAEYSNDIRRTDLSDACDRFCFNISVADTLNLENKTMFFCVRYNVNGTEYWDSNNGINYQVDFAKNEKKKSAPKPQPTGLGARPLNALPRSRPSPTLNGRPKSMSVLSFDDFAHGFDDLSVLTKSPATIIGEPTIKLRSPRSKQELVPDALARRNKPVQPVFGNRYDFNSSLTAAKNNAVAILGEESRLGTTNTTQSGREVPALVLKSLQRKPLEDRVTGGPVVSSAPAVTASAKPATLFSEKPPLTSQTYQELVDKYCFFGKQAPTAKMKGPYTTDGAVDDRTSSESTAENSQTSSGASTPVQRPSSASFISFSSGVSAYSIHRTSSPNSNTACGNSRTSPCGAGRHHFRSNSLQTLLAESPRLNPIHG